MTTLRCKSLKSYFLNAVAAMAWGLMRQARHPINNLLVLKGCYSRKKEQRQKQNNYVKTDRSAGRAQSDAMTRARSAASASEASSEV